LAAPKKECVLVAFQGGHAQKEPHSTAPPQYRDVRVSRPSQGPATDIMTEEMTKRATKEKKRQEGKNRSNHGTAEEAWKRQRRRDEENGRVM